MLQVWLDLFWLLLLIDVGWLMCVIRVYCFGGFGFACGWFMLLFSFFVCCLGLIVNSVVVYCSLCYESALRLF